MESMDGVLDRLRAVSVSGDSAAELVSLFGNSGHFLECILRCAGLIAFAADAAGRADLDEVKRILRTNSSRLRDLLPHVSACLAHIESLRPGQIVRIGS